MECANARPHDPHDVPGFFGAMGFRCPGKGYPDSVDDPGPQDGSEDDSQWHKGRIGRMDTPEHDIGGKSYRELFEEERDRRIAADEAANRAWAQAHAAAGRIWAATRTITEAIEETGTDDRLDLMAKALRILVGTVTLPEQMHVLGDEGPPSVISVEHARELEARARNAEAVLDIAQRQVGAQNVTLSAQAEMIDQLKSQVVSESVVDSEMFPPGYETMFLPGHAERTATFWKRRFVSQEAEMEHLREFKRAAHQALDEAGVAPYPDVACRIEARIEALARTMVAADQQAQEHMRRGNDYRAHIQELAEAMGRIRRYLRDVSFYVPAQSDGGGCLVTIAMLLDDHLPGYTPIMSSDRGQVYPEQEHDAETDAEDAVERTAQRRRPGTKRLRMYRGDVVVREVILPAGSLYDEVFDGLATAYDRLEYTDA